MRRWQTDILCFFFCAVIQVKPLCFEYHILPATSPIQRTFVVDLLSGTVKLKKELFQPATPNLVFRLDEIR
jgi:hypothetical protein